MSRWSRDVLGYLQQAIEAYGSDCTLAIQSVAPRPPQPPQPSQPAAVVAPAAPAPAPLATDRWSVLQRQVLHCQLCALHSQRKRTVFGEGDPHAEVMFVGEAPGAEEDASGRPFVGPAGRLLTAIINGAMGLPRAAVYIANINKCRPPANRTPSPEEANACLPYLAAQVELVKPKVLVCLGRTAAHFLLGRNESVGQLRGQTLQYLGTPVVVTWHPSYLLRDPSHKVETWQDIKQVLRLLGRPERPTPLPPEDPLA